MCMGNQKGRGRVELLLVSDTFLEVLLEMRLYIDFALLLNFLQEFFQTHSVLNYV